MSLYLEGYPIFLVLLRILFRKHYFDKLPRGINEDHRIGKRLIITCVGNALKMSEEM